MRLGAGRVRGALAADYLDVTHPEANKGMVVREASRLLHSRWTQIATIGDMPNDVPMLTLAGLGIAMGNASPEVQRVARHVTYIQRGGGLRERGGHSHPRPSRRERRVDAARIAARRRCAGPTNGRTFVVRWHASPLAISLREDRHFYRAIRKSKIQKRWPR